MPEDKWTIEVTDKGPNAGHLQFLAVLRLNSVAVFTSYGNTRARAVEAAQARRMSYIVPARMPTQIIELED